MLFFWLERIHNQRTQALSPNIWLWLRSLPRSVPFVAPAADGLMPAFATTLFKVKTSDATNEAPVRSSLLFPVLSLRGHLL